MSSSFALAVPVTPASPPTVTAKARKDVATRSLDSIGLPPISLIERFPVRRPLKDQVIPNSPSARARSGSGRRADQSDTVRCPDVPLRSRNGSDVAEEIIRLFAEGINDSNWRMNARRQLERRLRTREFSWLDIPRSCAAAHFGAICTKTRQSCDAELFCINLEHGNPRETALASLKIDTDCAHDRRRNHVTRSPVP